MSKNRKIGIALWAIAFILSVFLLLIIPDCFTGSVYVTLVFDGIAFISTIIAWLYLFKKSKSITEVFYCSPVMMVSSLYITIQFVLCVVTGLFADEISLKLSLILNFILTMVMWFVILSAVIAKNHEQHIDTRQKNHHVEL